MFASIPVLLSAADSPYELYLKVEENPALMSAAKKVATENNLPVSIYLPDRLFIFTLALEQNEPVYGIIRDFAHPDNGFETAVYSEIQNRYNLTNAVIRYGDEPIKSSLSSEMVSPGDSLLLIPDWTADRVLAFNPQSGDLIDDNFIPSSSSLLSSPKEARGTPWGNISVSDQLQDLVQEFDTSGTHVRILAPAGGVNNAILDNIRGHAYHPNGNLVATVGSGVNTDAIPEFDQDGNYLGNFITAGLGGLDSPFGIAFRNDDVLISGSSSSAIHRYDLTGSSLGIFATVSSYPQQVIELADGRIAVGNFSGSSGVLLYDSNGTFLSALTGVTGNRGVWQLGNGNFITTNGSGVHEIDGTSGGLVRTIYSGVSAQFVNLYVVPQDLTPKLLITEFVVTPTNGEFVEIFNPNDISVDLSNYFLTDATFAGDGTYYYKIVEGGGGGGGFGDFHARFPDGATIQAGEYQTVALAGDSVFFTEYNVLPTYELFEDGTNFANDVPDMREAFTGSINNQGGLTNGDEVIILYYWDGSSDLVEDVDYVLYNSGSPVANDEAVDKTGVRIDGPDAGTDSSEYLPDTPVSSQRSAINHSAGFSVHRIDFSEGLQVSSGGNGVTGADETSENLDETFSNNSIPSPNGSWQPATSARVQIVHNAADPALSVVDVYLSGTRILDDLTFRSATPFLDVPADMPVNLGIAPGNSGSVADTIKNFNVTFDQGGTYIGFATGVLNTSQFLPNPDGEDISFTIFGQDTAREQALTPGLVDLFVMHGITDVPAIDIYPRNGNILFNNVTYGEVTGYVSLTPDLYLLDVTDSTGTEILASFSANLTTLADSAVAIFASGFGEPDSNQNGPSPGLFLLQANGTVSALPEIPNFARVQLIHNSPDPALDTVDVYLEDSLLVDNFVFRQATPFFSIPAGQTLYVGFAPANSTSSSDTILAFPAEFPPNAILIGTAIGVLDPGNFVPNPNGLDITFNIIGPEQGRDVSLTAGEVEFYVVHGAPDAPAVDVAARNVGTLFQNLLYGEVTEYVNVTPGNYIIDLYDSTGTTQLAAFTADLSGLADSALTVFASGFLDTVGNQNGPSFGLFAALANGTVIQLPSIPVGIVDQPVSLPRSYALHQNFPNPFNPSTTIKYDLKQSGRVVLTVYNLLGQEVVKLVDENQEAGYKTVQWNGRNGNGTPVASGIYLYRFEAGDFVKIRKMILMK